ncbi:uncharacterized protein LOC105421803 isoform X2 [Amborella trichopoda]|uniref:uncharacterized protein LOC105421803 isoform X2 n=1 Tax=Amborella trichopoda TaxID=13333 RepID=UPI0009BD0128|nr:uncharacterized protein LOC105421803 isoform X2 [Amborella trichopoda]|eukprot:XP_020517222.1 uncharacterized protein LOC105421803 isoform X2 [Amborella trichopoda]
MFMRAIDSWPEYSGDKRWQNLSIKWTLFVVITSRHFMTFFLPNSHCDRSSMNPLLLSLLITTLKVEDNEQLKGEARFLWEICLWGCACGVNSSCPRFCTNRVIFSLQDVSINCFTGAYKRRNTFGQKKLNDLNQRLKKKKNQPKKDPISLKDMENASDWLVSDFGTEEVFLGEGLTWEIVEDALW